MDDEKMKVGVKLSILGSNSVGKAIGKVFERYRIDVIFYDRDRTVLNALAAEGYRVSSDLADAIKRSNISFICVLPTVRTGGFDSSDVEEVYSRIIEISKEEYHLIVFKSVVSPKFLEILLAGHRDNNSNYGICMNPAFICSEFMRVRLSNPSLHQPLPFNIRIASLTKINVVYGEHIQFQPHAFNNFS